MPTFKKPTKPKHPGAGATQASLDKYLQKIDEYWDKVAAVERAKADYLATKEAAAKARAGLSGPARPPKRKTKRRR